MEAKQKQEKIVLNAQSRTVLGKQVKKLRKEGFIPANIFGKDFASLAITVSLNDFTKVYNEAGETGVVYVDVEGADKDIPTLIKSVQKHPVNDNILHIDLRKINLRQKIETQVPLAYTGEAPVEKEGAVIMYPVDVITVEALPANIPSEITIDLSTLTEIGQEVKVADLPKSEDYTVVDDPEMVIVSVTAHKEESVEPDTSTTIPEGEEGAVEGEAPAEGEATEGGEAAPEGGDEAKEE